MAPGRTLATILFTESDIKDVDVADRPSDMSSDALIITPLDATDDRGTVAYLLTDTSLADECDITVVVNDADELSSYSELVQRDNDGGHRDREPARL